jgi:hypothetical protein
MGRQRRQTRRSTARVRLRLRLRQLRLGQRLFGNQTRCQKTVIAHAAQRLMPACPPACPRAH